MCSTIFTLDVMGTSSTLDFGCGNNKTEDAIGLDIVKLDSVDIIASAEAPYFPFQDNSFDKMICNHVIEHVKDVLHFIEEACRVVRPGGEIIIRTPHFTSYGAYTDPTHKQLFGYYSFDYFCSPDEAADVTYNYYSDAKVTIIDRHLSFNKTIQKYNYLIEWIANKKPEYYEMSPLRLFPAGEMYYKLQVKNS